MIVVDASVFTNMLAYSDERGRKARVAVGRDIEWLAPQHWKAEVFSAIRGLALGGKIDQQRAARAVGLIPHLGVDAVSLDELLPRMWKLRSATSAYDSAYVALAESRDAELVTADVKLARTALGYCRVDLST